MSELFKELYCGLTNNYLTLSCGHSICKQCVPDQVKIKCKIRTIETDKSSPFKTMNTSYLSGLFEELEKRAKNEINSF